MSASFDPYHRWLGIPPEQQPADHYRLLGLARFESDLEVIRDAAERQMGHVRRYSLGKNSELSQRVLNELAAAKTSLLDPTRKAKYDRRLREALRIAQAKARPAAQTAVSGATAKSADEESKAPPEMYGLAVPATTVPVPPVPPSHLPVDVPALPSNSRTKKRKVISTRLAFVGGTAGALLLAVVLAVMVYLRGPSGDGQASAQLGSDPSASSTDEAFGQVKLAKIADQAVEQGQPLRIEPKLLGGPQPGRTLRFGLAPGAPPGCQIEAATGLIQWTATPMQAPGRYAMTIWIGTKENASFADKTSVADHTSFVVDVRPARPRPVLRPISEQKVLAGGRFVLRVSIADAQELRRPPIFSIVNGPAWAQIDRQSGIVVCAPPADEMPGSYRMSVVAHGEGAVSFHDEKPLNIVVLGIPRRVPEPPPSVQALIVKSADGKTLTPADWEIGYRTLADSQEQLMRLMMNPKGGVIPVYRDGAMAGPLIGLCGYNAITKKLDGFTLTVHPGLSHRYETFVEYHAGDRHGVLATWDAQGGKEYWGQYERDRCHPFCCLFKNDRPAIVVVYDRGTIRTVHLVANGGVSRSFATEAEARNDREGRLLLEALDGFESRYKQSERLLEAQVKKTVQLRIGKANEWRRALEGARRDADWARQKGVIRGQIRTATGN